MEASFWHERWQQGQIGFHQPDFHPALPRHWPGLDVRPGNRVLVPLCGRSLDMVWLAQRSHPVLGVELSPIAAAGFFEHEALPPLRDSHGPFDLYASAHYEILQGDFFDITPELAGPIHAWYDRAALVALPPPMRRRYALHLGELLAPGTRGLLITVEYPQEKMSGPPFSVPVDEVHTLFDGDFEVELLERGNVLAANPRFAARGLDQPGDALYEAVFRLERR
jgi:thiopurine S-methyltransferase